ncbi:hypothetical protein ACFB49_42260 [Sphingomonas sp. DBB INV C78]
MLCCAIAAIGLAGAWMAHRLRLIGGLALLTATAVAGGSILLDLRDHDGATMSASQASSTVSLCSGTRPRPDPPYPKLGAERTKEKARCRGGSGPLPCPMKSDQNFVRTVTP